MERRKTRKIDVGDVAIGGGARMTIQSMCNTDTRDVAATGAQIRALYEAGCDIVRVAVPDMDAAKAIRLLKKTSQLPIVADVHFDWRLAVEACNSGADKIRVNPGNIGSKENLAHVAKACKGRGIPIRIGVNSGSLDRALLQQYGVTPEALCESAGREVARLHECDFEDICVSIKASGVFTTVEAYRLFAKKSDLPLHLGVTEAGTAHIGTIKSACAFGALLCDGIGDTLRVSLTDDPVREVFAAKDILKALDMNTSGVNLISCPTCGRTSVNMIPIVQQVEQRLKNVQAKLTIAIMGCAVNGPGEAREADIGIACGKGEGLLFRNGEIVRKVPEENLADELIKEVAQLSGEKID